MWDPILGCWRLENQDYPYGAKHESYITKVHQAIEAGETTISEPSNPKLDAEMAKYARGEPPYWHKKSPSPALAGESATNPIDLTNALPAPVASSSTTTKTGGLSNTTIAPPTQPSQSDAAAQTYCLCKSEDGSGNMIACEADGCPDGTDSWFHWDCVGIQADPGEEWRWICPRCVVRTGEAAIARK